MKAKWFTNLLIITLVLLSLGFLDVGVVFGYIHNSHNNYIDNTGGWPVHDTYYNENLREINDLYKNNIDIHSNHKKTSSNKNDFASDANKETNNNITNDEKNYDQHKIENIKKVYQTAINEMIINSNKTENNKLESQIKQLEDNIKEKQHDYYLLFTFMTIISITSITLISILSFFRYKEIYKKDNSQSCLKPDINEIENLIQQSNSLKYDFKNIQHESDLTLFTKFDLLKDDFYNELNKVD